jgi:hypothetical protein
MEANEEGFREQRRKKRNNSSENEAPQRGNKKPATYLDGQNQNKATSNFFAPLRAEMEAEDKQNEEGHYLEILGQRNKPTGGKQCQLSCHCQRTGEFNNV